MGGGKGESVPQETLRCAMWSALDGLDDGGYLRALDDTCHLNGDILALV